MKKGKRLILLGFIAGIYTFAFSSCQEDKAIKEIWQAYDGFNQCLLDENKYR